MCRLTALTSAMVSVPNRCHKLGTPANTRLQGPKAPLNQTIAAGSDIAVCTDDTATEYVFFQAEGGMITKSTLSPEAPSFGTFTAMKGGTIGSKLAASFLDSGASSSGAALTFQSSSNDTTMWLSQWSRSDAALLDMAVT